MDEKVKSSKVSKEEIEKNKGMAIVAWFIFFVPLLTDAKDSKFVKFHVNQSLIFVITSFVAWTVVTLLSFLLIGLLLIPIVSIALIVLWIMGLMSAINGEMKRLPLIGNFNLIK